MPEIIGYAYEATIYCPDCARDSEGNEVHPIFYCPDCARKRFGDAIDDDVNPPVDREGNEVRPIFSTDEEPGYECYCDRCGEYIYGRVRLENYKVILCTNSGKVIATFYLGKYDSLTTGALEEDILDTLEDEAGCPF